MLDYKIADNAYFAVEGLITSMKNSITLKDSFYQGDASVGSFFSNIKQEYKFQYIQIPLTIKMKTNAINGMKYNFQAGIAPSALISRQIFTLLEMSTGLLQARASTTTLPKFSWRLGSSSRSAAL